MKRAGRWLFNLAAAKRVAPACALLAFVLLGLLCWIQSSLLGDWFFSFGRNYIDEVLISNNSQVSLVNVQWLHFLRPVGLPEAGKYFLTAQLPPLGDGTSFSDQVYGTWWGGYRTFGRGRDGRPLIEETSFEVRTQLAGCLCFIPLLPTIVRAIRGMRRRTRGLCPVCSYDLRATPERCPECGTAVQRTVEGAGGGGA
jgi:hypothetical protein